MGLITFAVIFVHILSSKAASPYEAQSRLEATLLQNYSKEIRPVFNHKDNVTVTVGISLSQIHEMNDKSQILTLNLWIRQIWYDPRLVWNTSAYAMTKQIHVDPNKIWVPDLKVYNEVGTQLDHGLDQLHTKAIVYNTGKIQWMSPSVKKLSCRVDMKFFPHDTQHCKLKIGSWTYDGFALDVKPESYTMDISKSPSNPEWELINTSVERNVQVYKCCPEPFPDVTYIVVLKRRERSYWMNFIFPGVFLTVLTMMTFVTPAQDTGERISLVLTSLVSMFFFLKLVSERTPASDTIPLLTVYFVMLSFEIGLILYSVCLSINAFHKHPSLGEMPGYVRSIVLKRLGNLWTLGEDRERIRRRLGALQDLSLMKDDIKNELENIKSHCHSIESRGKKHSLENCNSKCEVKHNENNLNSTSAGFQPSVACGPSSESGDKCIAWLDDIDDNVSSRDVSSLENGEAQLPAVCTCSLVLDEMVKCNQRLLFAIRQIVYVARQRDKVSCEKECWLIAAVILDRVFLVFFVLIFVIFSLVNFLW